MKEIFVNEIAWMRNDYPVSIVVAGITYPTVEHAYQAAKFKDLNIKNAIAKLPVFDVKKARSIGRKTSGINQYWDDIKENVMERLIRQKFSKTHLGDLLANTGNSDIVFQNRDDFWGTGGDINDECWNGQNILGTILESIRDDLQFDRGIDPNNEIENKSNISLSKTVLNTNKYVEDFADAFENLYLRIKVFLGRYCDNKENRNGLNDPDREIQETIRDIEDLLVLAQKENSDNDNDIYNFSDPNMDYY
jgi:hypothetical protein